MELQTLLIINAVVCPVLGLLLLFAPSFGFSMFGANESGAGTFPAQEYGAAMMRTMLFTWFARPAPASLPGRASPYLAVNTNQPRVVNKSGGTNVNRLNDIFVRPPIDGKLF